MAQSDDYDCTRCGACCRCFPIYASAKDAEHEPRIQSETRLIEAHLTSEERSYQLFPLPFHEQCAFLKADQLCSIYASRPKVCRQFEAGSPQCIEARERVGFSR